MLRHRFQRQSAEYLGVVLLSLVSAISYHVFIFQNAFAPAGIDGMATMIQYVFNINVGYLSLLVNIPLLLVAFVKLDRTYAVRTLCFILVFSFALILLERMGLSQLAYKTENGTSTILAPVAAGVINGFVYGYLIRLNGSKGGIDIIAALIRRRRPSFDLMWIIFTINCIVAGISFFVYDYSIEPVILCIVYCFTSSSFANKILHGNREAIKFEIANRTGG